MISRKVIVGIGVCAIVFLYQFYQFNILQDDAFISFRYIRNFLDGHGLVFNIGERVEGYTNFFWIILLSLLTKLGLPLIETSRVLGVLASIGTLVLSAYAAHKLYPKRNWLWVLSVPLLLAANGAFAYWAGSGLETGLFTLLAAAAAITYLTNTPLSLLLVTLATLTRPEGALLAFLFGVAGVILKQKSWKATLMYWGALALLMLPYVVFKWFYFGSLLPNPFYAKTGFSAEYWKSGLEYTALFFKHYGLYGVVLLLPLIFWRKLSIFSRFCFLVFLGYTLYIVSVGGDVLKAHRFFVPLMAMSFFPFADSLWQGFSLRKNLAPGFFFAVLLAAGYAYRAPLNYLNETAFQERGLVNGKIMAGCYFSEQDTARSFALSTIGAFSYYAGSRRVIDLLGLTDPQVAKNPEKIEGIVSTWKEQNFNAAYVLAQKPDVILFSTGIKPSAPAERALFLYPDFRRNYRLEFFYRDGSFDMFYRRFRNLPAEPKPDQPAEIANRFNKGINLIGMGDFSGAVAALRQTISEGPKDCAVFYTALGYAYFSARMPESTEVYLKKGMELDGGGSISRYYYRNLLRSQKKLAGAAEQESILVRTVPNARLFLSR